ncbi:phosphoethanolamine transferase CptA [Pseudomonas aeruginosa]|nr:phosphoethanolamine transferase CptA [Pseudomonas aeruginosa]
MSPTPPRVTRNRIDWAGLGWLFLFFWFFSGITQLLLLTSGNSGFSGFRNAMVLSTIWLAPVLLFPRWTKPLAAVIGLVLWAASLVGLSYFGIYHQEFSQSVIFVMFESNTAEASEYFSQYFNPWMTLGLVLYSLVAILLWRRLRPVYLPRFSALPVAVLLIVATIGYPFYKQLVSQGRPFDEALDKVQARMEPAVPWQLLIGYQQYRQQLGSMQALLQKNAALPPLKNLVDANGDTPRTLVLVIGESTSRKHMSLYGYPRETTPQLDALKAANRNLTVFNNVVASRPYTIEVLQQVLTFADQEHPDRFLTDPSLMNLMKQAGYKTFWITNQQTMTKRNTMLTTFAQQTDAQFYLNNQRSQNASQLDGAVLAPFAKVLDDPAPKKFIVVHLLGTHMNYKYRYPADYARFVDRPGAPAARSADQGEVYNSYDNAVLYNDYVVSSLIKGFANSDPNGFLVYLSDHGEEVFDEAPHDRLGRNEGDPTRGMYTVPFLVWTSPSWQQTHPRDLQALVDRRYSSEDLIHTWSDLAGLNYDLFDPTKSLVSNDFQHEVRWIGNPYAHNGLRDFDKLPLDKADAGQQVAPAGRPAPTTPRAPSRQPNEG